MRAYVTVVNGEDDLVPYFVRYYKRLGATRFPVIVYGTRQDLDRVCATISTNSATPLALDFFAPDVFSAWHREQQIRKHHPDGEWAFFADLDEFPQITVNEISRVVAGEATYVSGRWLDRVGLDGHLPTISQQKSLEEQFPMGADLRWAWGMRNSCYVLSPQAPFSHHPHACKWGRRFFRNGCYKVRVHHFKWQANVVPRLEYRLERIKALGKAKSGWYRRNDAFFATFTTTMGSTPSC